ncbi:hypothetical protein F5Y10DRAFT_252048 [Nemania abortiva]|nr:hypothetical protein F5Y10DRAFT_252048 [Nemania abortiva]
MAVAIPAPPAIPPANEGPLLLTRPGFNPTVDDVIEARRIITELRVGKHTVPMEIALMILSFASYQPCQSNIKQREKIYEANEFWRSTTDASIAGLYLTVATLSIPGAVARPKSITFQMKAADQGWATFGGNGTYNNSHTWFEASILRPRSDESARAALTSTDMRNFRTPGEARGHLQDLGWDIVEDNGTIAWRVHNNITACSANRLYRVDWVAGVPAKVGNPQAMGDGQGFLEHLRPSDVVVLWARAEQQAWINKAQGAAMEIVYEVL